MLNRKPEPKKPVFQYYVPVKGDTIDEMLADYINTNGSRVNWVRNSEGNYLYGANKKVSIKLIRNNLIVKVGGGSYKIEEFVANYEEIELAKINYTS